MRIFWYLTGKLSAELVTPRQKLRTEDDCERIFLSAGNLAYAQEAFEFLKPLMRRRQYTFLQFKAIGWSVRSTVEAVVSEVTREMGSDGQVMFFTISLGDHVARHLENSSIQEQLKVCAINPCPHRMAVRKELRTALVVLAPIFWGLCHLLGWLSIIPLIPATGGKYSLVLLADQYLVVAFDMPTLFTAQTPWLVLSTGNTDKANSDCDGLLDNNYLQKTYPRAKVEWVRTGHADTRRMGAEYLHSVQKLLELQEE